MFQVTCWKRAKRGFTLAEVIVSLTILSSIMLFFYQAYYAGNKASLSNKQKLDALFIAENKLESYRSSPQGVLTNYTETETLNNVDYKVVTNAILESSTSSARLYSITVEVTAQGNGTNKERLGTKLFVLN